MLNPRHGRTGFFLNAWQWCFVGGLVSSALVAGDRSAQAQRVVRAPEQVVSVSKGASALLVNPTAIQRFSIGDPAVAEAVVVSPTEILINGKTLGTTSLFLWDNQGQIKLYSVEVTADAPGLQRYLASVLQGERIDVIASGNVVTLSGQVRDASVATRAVEIAKGSGATIVDNLTTPEAVQVLLKVRFAEVNKSAIKEFRSQLATLNPQDLNARTGDWAGTDTKRGRSRSDNRSSDSSAEQSSPVVVLVSPRDHVPYRAGSVGRFPRQQRCLGREMRCAEPATATMPKIFPAWT